MLIQCTRKLLKELKISPSKYEVKDDLFSWHANFLFINRRKTVVLVNDKNKFSIVLYGLIAKDFKNFANILKKSLRLAFIIEGVDEKIIDLYLQDFRNITFAKTYNQSFVYSMSHNIRIVKNQLYYILNDENAFQVEATRELNRYTIYKEGNFMTPVDMLINDLKIKYGNAISVKAYKFKITLALDNYEVWREMIVPSTKSLEEFHKLIQIAFSWKDYHLHEFFVYSKERYDEPLSYNHSAYHPESYKILYNFLGQEEEYLFDDEEYEVYLEDDVYLNVIPTLHMKYVYDYGDNWEHFIEQVGVIDNYNDNHAKLVSYYGEAPPEDVGGSRGFDHFLEIINDNNHEDREYYLNWSKAQGYKEDFVKEFEKKSRLI